MTLLSRIEAVIDLVKDPDTGELPNGQKVAATEVDHGSPEMNDFSYVHRWTLDGLTGLLKRDDEGELIGREIEIQAYEVALFSSDDENGEYVPEVYLNYHF